MHYKNVQFKFFLNSFMKKLPDLYRLILEVVEPPPESSLDVPINPPRKESGVGLYNTDLYDNPSYKPWEYIDDPADQNDWFGWDEWDGTGEPPPNWPRIRVVSRWSNGRPIFIPFTAERPADYPPWEEWPPQPGHEIYRRYQEFAKRFVNPPDWVKNQNDFYKWAYGYADRAGLWQTSNWNHPLIRFLIDTIWDEFHPVGFAPVEDLPSPLQKPSWNFPNPILRGGEDDFLPYVVIPGHHPSPYNPYHMGPPLTNDTIRNFPRY
jgi:hypothetical protein